jgi:outer membrane protein OmpA-like peptidoglycan-associated protein
MNFKFLKLVALLISLYAPMAMADDADSLKELENAMKGSTPEVVHKHKTRAIVFDEKPDAPQAAVQAHSTDCSSLPADVKSTAVNFSIQFKSGSSEVAGSSVQTLDNIAKLLSLNSNCVIVEGHTDSIGNADKNLVLSRQRADSVVNYISDKGGLDKKRLIPVGKGSNEPLKNLNPRDAQNRRVVFKVVS